MNSKKEKKILVSLLQNALSKNMTVSPQGLADAIITKLDLNRPIAERNARNVEEAIKFFNKAINDIDNDMDTELEQLGKDEVLLKNFVNGQKTVCEKLREKINEI